MNAPELYALRQRLNESRALLCFNGPISRSLLEEFGKALKRYLEVDHVRPAEALDVFSVYIEITQNIRQYAIAQGYDDNAAAATIVISRGNDGHYVVSAGNVVEMHDADDLVAKIQQYSAMTKAELKTLYKERLRRPRNPDNPESVGLGLLEIARRASAPLQATASEHQGNRSFFSISVVI